MGRKIKGLLFDKDGTLYGFHATWATWTRDFIRLVAKEPEAQSALSDAFGFNMQTSAFEPHSIVIAATPEIILETTHQTLPHLDRAEVDRLLVSSSSTVALAEAVPLIPLLDRFLGNDLQLGVATNDLESVAHAHLSSSSIIDKFTFIAGSDSGHGAKPAPGMQHAFCAATGLDPSEVAMVGDSTHDLEAGRNAGMTAIAVLTGPASAEELAQYADVTLGSIGEIPDWLGLPA